MGNFLCVAVFKFTFNLFKNINVELYVIGDFSFLGKIFLLGVPKAIERNRTSESFIYGLSVFAD